MYNIDKNIKRSNRMLCFIEKKNLNLETEIDIREHYHHSLKDIVRRQMG